MARFTVLGVHRETGRDSQLPIEADSAANAKIKAEIQGVTVTRVVPLDAPAYYDSMPHPAALRSSIKIPVLISAISNIVVGLLWLASCFGAILVIPMVVLCVFEFKLYADADTIPDSELGVRAKNLGIFEIIVGLFNTVSLVCGILVLINAGKLAPAPRAS